MEISKPAYCLCSISKYAALSGLPRLTAWCLYSPTRHTRFRAMVRPKWHGVWAERLCLTGIPPPCRLHMDLCICPDAYLSRPETLSLSVPLQVRALRPEALANAHCAPSSALSTLVIKEEEDGGTPCACSMLGASLSCLCILQSSLSSSRQSVSSQNSQ